MHSNGDAAMVSSAQVVNPETHTVIPTPSVVEGEE